MTRVMSGRGMDGSELVEGVVAAVHRRENGRPTVAGERRGQSFDFPAVPTSPNRTENISTGPAQLPNRWERRHASCIVARPRD